MKKSQEKISKYLSFILRHNPEAIGLSLDTQGWANVEELLEGMKKINKAITRNELQEIVEKNDKKRFTFSNNGLYIRAAQGHSLKNVDISFEEKTPPDLLFHGTASRFLQSIKQKGLIPGSRHYVHLSEEEKTAKAVGLRYGVPVILKINAGVMCDQGHKFYQADNGVWLTNNVPVKFLQF